MLTLAAMGFLSPAAVQAQGAIEAWVQRDSGPANGDDAANGEVVDANGIICVCGVSHGDIGGVLGDYR